MQPLLYLVHRIPYPPDKGDKIRSYHLLTHLLKKYSVYLGAFIDDDVDWQHEKKLQEMCAQVFLQDLNPFKSKIKSMAGFLTNKALTLPYYADGAMQRWVNNVIEQNNIRQVVVYSSAMAQYIDHENKNSINRIVDFVDVDSDKWRQYSEKKSWPMSWIYKREARCLFDYEIHIAKAFDASLFVSQTESDHFQRLAGVPLEKVNYYFNGVDTEYFSPVHEYTNPFKTHEKAIVFTGAMDYWANIDAVIWFSREIFPFLYAQDNQVRFYIVGARPSAEVKALSQLQGVVVTGRVPDVRPYLAHSCFAVAPMRIARGIQNKVLEAMSMRCRVLLTPQGAEGIAARSGSEWLEADSVSSMRSQASNLLECNAFEGMGEKARDFVLSHFNWDANLSRIDQYLSN